MHNHVEDGCDNGYGDDNYYVELLIIKLQNLDARLRKETLFVAPTIMLMLLLVMMAVMMVMVMMVMVMMVMMMVMMVMVTEPRGPL